MALKALAFQSCPTTPLLAQALCARPASPTGSPTSSCSQDGAEPGLKCRVHVHQLAHTTCPGPPFLSLHPCVHTLGDGRLARPRVGAAPRLRVVLLAGGLLQLRSLVGLHVLPRNVLPVLDRRGCGGSGVETRGCCAGGRLLMYVFVGLQAAARRPVLHPSAPMLHSPRQLNRREEKRRGEK